ncbi:MAG: DUF4012 domain-containing protein [bacterium]|nr:DUF4012 domain-containing protein [bacterium]
MRKFLFFLVILMVIIGGVVVLTWKDLFSIRLSPVVQDKDSAVSFLSGELFKQVLGLDAPRTYLVLYLNNTELRPGGGFIGAYAVVKMSKAVPDIIKVEGTEILDNLAPRDFVSVPPAPVEKYLKVSRLNFRDSNWSPDFAVSAIQALNLYKKERGANADEITAVIGITPTVMENVLKIIGPITADGIEFTSANFTEKLEYEVEYDYEKRGISFSDRKQILADLTAAVISKLRNSILTHWSDYWKLANAMLDQKQVILFSTETELQKFAVGKKWAGIMNRADGDYLLWADANLGALKTDAVMDRELSYKIYKNDQGEWLGEAAMTYNHLGKFDWRTSQYLDYARVYLPMGSQFVSVSGQELVDYPLTHPADQGDENGFQWFGTFVKVYPGKEKVLTFKFKLADTVLKSIESGSYKLLAQKQIGTIANTLTLDLNFGKTLTYGNPSETKEHLGDVKYQLNTDLLVDRVFEVKF